MNDQTAERIHQRIDETHKLINDVKTSYAVQTQDMKNLSKDIEGFISKVDKNVFDTNEGFIVKTKTKLSSVCVQLKNQWYLITLILMGLIGTAWMVIRNNK